MSVHKDKPEVKELLKLPKKARINKLEQLKRLGMVEVNVEEAKKADPVYQRQRTSKNSKSIPKMCTSCKSFINSNSFVRHQKTCQGDSDGFKIDIAMLRTPTEECSELFKSNVLATMRNDSIGSKAKTDHAILIVGCRLLGKK